MMSAYWTVSCIKGKTNVLILATQLSPAISCKQLIPVDILPIIRLDDVQKDNSARSSFEMEMNSWAKL